jgi:O-antigen biosynthesis protein
MSRCGIIVAHNQSAFTRRCLASLASMRPGFDEMVLVDNGSTDDTSAVFERFRAAFAGSCTVIRLPENVGGCASRNRAVEVANSSEVFFLDNDTVVIEPEWLNHLSGLLQRDGGAVAPTLVYPSDGLIIQSAGGGVTKDMKVGLLRRGSPYAPIRTALDVAWAPTACLGCLRTDFLDVGGFDEELDPISIGEDIDLCFKLRARGKPVQCMLNVRLVHYEGTTFNNSTFSPRKREAFVKHMRWLRRRWQGSWAQLPQSAERDIRYVSVIKNYADLSAASVVVLPDEISSFADHLDGKALASESKQP